MDIFNRPPAISEDTLQYYLYPQSGLSDKTSVTAFAACIDSFVDDLTAGMIWHRDAFELKVASDPDVSEGYLLEGRMRVGDCVDDEWCVVWLLKEISTKWDLAISVYDSDGEFLLIEAAEALPSWVKPSNTENRVWIYSSRMHLVPLSHVSPPSRPRRRRRLPNSRDSDDEDNHIGEDGDDDWIAVGDALKVVRDPSVNTLSPSEVEGLVWKRISGYPTAIKSHVHVTKALVPLDIARALSVNPALIQKPVETFYTRDALQLRAAHRMSRFPPELSVLRTVKMTRTAYAQLVGQKFHPPKIFGKPTAKEGTDAWRWQDVGMKVACGFEMLYQESKSRADVSSNTTEAMRSSSDARKEALRRNPEYLKYIQNLISAAYFQGELEGSQRWNELEDKAAATFVDVRKTDDASRPSFSVMLTTAISQSKEDSVNATQEKEDSDEWLNVDAQDFDDMLEKTMGTSRSNKLGPPEAMDVDNPEGETEEDRAAKAQASRLQDLAQKVESFVEGEGDVEGAKFEDEESSADEFSDEKMSNSDDDSEPEELNLAERRAAMDKLVPGLGPSEYGQMPASYHANSQRVAPTMETGVDTESNSPKKDSKPSAESETPMKPIRQPILPRDKYDGVDSDDETDDEDGPEADDESEEDQPQVVGEVEVDMGEEEEEFLEFSRQALGISDEQWGEIVRDRKGRGAFVPSSAMNMPAPKTSHSAQEARVERQKPVQGRPPAPGPRPNVNPNLDSFEAVMQAMDAELARTRQPKTKTDAPPAPAPSTDKGKGKAKATSSEDEADIESAMDAELKSILERGDEGSDEENPADYNLIKNFLESFKSQGGLSGPVSNLAGRLQPDWQLPRDEAS